MERERVGVWGAEMARVDRVGMNKRKREENFAFGTTDQSNSQRNGLLMRAIQGTEGGSGVEEEKRKGMALHSCRENKEMNHTGCPVEDMGVCVCVLAERVALPSLLCLSLFLGLFSRSF